MELTNISSFFFLDDPEEDIYDLSDGIPINHRKETKMDPVTITIITTVGALISFAIKYGPNAYAQLKDLFGDSIPTYEELAKENTELQTLIDAEK